ncbi:hypothetical protein [Abyssibacter sp.]|uniref:hypothetical protein n=1 Tax=Abyssibacter sp. TaxID=2320200 RepID=UPI0025B91183|nr:hypothetical protein [Abyssibacter sp.]MCK5860659.1 hypothetical protein [Abyssibacter sp.]
MSDANAGRKAGFKWGPFTLRIPFLQARWCWPEGLQGVLVAAATGLALVPIMTGYFGLSFEQAVAASLIHSVLISSAILVFGEPYAPGWITPALPLVLSFVIGGFDCPELRFQAMTALSLDFAFIVILLGVTGLGNRFMLWLPAPLKGGIILGAAIAAFKRVFLDDADKYLLAQPISTTLACVVCLLLAFSLPLQRLRDSNRFVRTLASLGLLPGFLLAALVGPLVGEIDYDIQWGVLLPPVHEVWAKASPLAIGWPDVSLLLQCLPLALVAYIILFGDLVTGNEVLRQSADQRPDDPVDINPARSHLSVGIRNVLMALTAPFFPTQGSLWAGVHVIVVQRWQRGRESMDQLFSGLASYYVMGLPAMFLLLPLLTGLKPLMGIALSLTLVLTGFACGFVAMAIPRNPTERGVVLLTGVAIAVFPAWVGLLVGIGATVALTGFSPTTDSRVS